MSNAEDLNRLTACSLVLLGHIFYVLGNHRVSAQASMVLGGSPSSSGLHPVPLDYLVSVTPFPQPSLLHEAWQGQKCSGSHSLWGRPGELWVPEGWAYGADRPSAWLGLPGAGTAEAGSLLCVLIPGMESVLLVRIPWVLFLPSTHGFFRSPVPTLT